MHRSSTRVTLVLIGALLSVTVPARAQDSLPGAARARIDQLFVAYDRPDSPGCALGIVDGGSLVHTRGFGQANLEHAVPITAQTVFDIGSTSKQITAASILLLVQQGKLGLDDDIRTFVPELPDYGRPVTVRHLLLHTSGLRDYLGLMSLAGVSFHDVTTDDDALQLITAQRALNFPPGDQYLYSNTGYFLLSVIVKRRAEMSLGEFAERHIFGPLEMRSTHFHDDHTMVVPRRATGYAPHPDGGFRIEMSNFEQTGDGAVYTTLEDLARWDANFYAPQVGGPALLDAFHERGILNDGRALPYARGLIVDSYRGLRSVSHAGAWAGYRAELLRFPDQRVSMIVLCNLASTNPSRLARAVADEYLAGRFPAAVASERARAEMAPSIRLAPTELDRVVGVYHHAASGELRRIRRGGDGLVLLSGGRERAIEPLTGARFRVAGQPVILEFTAERGAAADLHETVGEQAGERFRRIEPVSLSQAALAAYAGGYESAELSTTVQIVADGDSLVLQRRNAPDDVLEPSATDAFIAGPINLRFSRDAAGDIDGFLLSMGRIRNLHFSRLGGGAP